MPNKLREAPHSVAIEDLGDLSNWTSGVRDGFILIRQSNAVVWGVIEEDKPTFGPGYNESLIQEARAFNAETEICIYTARIPTASSTPTNREGTQWVRRTIVAKAETGPYSHALTRTYPLWGTSSEADPDQKGFEVWTEGSRGIQQSLPFGFKTPVLEVVHLYREDPDTGALYEAGFRLANLKEARQA